MNENNDGSSKVDIVERTFEFSVRIVRLARFIQRDPVSSVFARQICRSGTSVGANVEEAQDAQTKKEFSRKMRIARGEARETLYWLRLAQRTALLPSKRLDEIIGEANELLRILVAIVKSSSREI